MQAAKQNGSATPKGTLPSISYLPYQDTIPAIANTPSIFLILSFTFIDLRISTRLSRLTGFPQTAIYGSSRISKTLHRGDHDATIKQDARHLVDCLGIPAGYGTQAESQKLSSLLVGVALKRDAAD